MGGIAMALRAISETSNATFAFCETIPSALTAVRTLT
jgi:hypothetical protein